MHSNSRTANENRLGDFLQFILEIGQVVGIPELGQFLNGIGLRQLGFLHRLFHFRYLRFSPAVISRAVTGYPLPSGKRITTRRRPRMRSPWTSASLASRSMIFLPGTTACQQLLARDRRALGLDLTP